MDTTAPRSTAPGTAPGAAPGAAGLDALIAELSAVGDPPADAAADELAADPAARRALDRGLAEGAAVLDATATPALAAHLAGAEAVVRAAPAELLERACLPHFTISQAGHVFDLGAGALIHSYAPPGPAAVLVGTGRLVESAFQRLQDTARWHAAALLPGGLRPGQPGFAATVRVRLLHARVRRAVRRAAGGRGPVPISQVDTARTWLDFTLVTTRADAALGLELTEQEQRSLYAYWRVLGELLGIDPRLLAGAVDATGAELLAARIAAVTGPPGEDSRRLTRAGLTALADALPAFSPVPRRLARPLVSTVSRAMLGDALADDLGIARSRAGSAALRPVVAVVRARRRRLRRDPAAWRRAVEANVAATRAFALEGGAAGYER
ncbi:oxygenase MpaB family protein [Kineococcus sp. SYSU DK005]|uniref:oxygenase MpaB family protein n=1 Tax=Kineococcus sp. SYSU DK005 TaxID=3383126 RepID=UPI003D7D27C6